MGLKRDLNFDYGLFVNWPIIIIVKQSDAPSKELWQNCKLDDVIGS